MRILEDRKRLIGENGKRLKRHKGRRHRGIKIKGEEAEVENGFCLMFLR